MVKHYARYVKDVFTVDDFDWNQLTFTTGRVYLTPFEVKYTMTLDRIIIFYDTPVAGNIIGGFYRDNGDDPAGGAVVVESASVAKLAADFAHEIAFTATRFIPGLYWGAIESDENTTNVQRPKIAGWFFDARGAAQPSTLWPRYYDRAGGYGALTDPCPAVTDTNQVPICWARVASVP